MNTTEKVFAVAALALTSLGLLGAFVVPEGRRWMRLDWPDKLTQVKTAEVQVSDIDDIVAVKVNGNEAVRATYGETPGWISIKDSLHEGQNAIQVLIQNGKYGGCSGTVTLRLNGITDAKHTWDWKKQENQPPGTVCFLDVKTLNL
jgi:hypothetical protein